MNDQYCIFTPNDEYVEIDGWSGDEIDPNELWTVEVVDGLAVVVVVVGAWDDVGGK